MPPAIVAKQKLVLSCLSRSLKRSMGTFVPNLSPMTGKMEWIMRDDDYDYHQEIARSAYADMLHDTERNHKYYLGLKAAINQMHRRGLKAHVLDIGTGTGLLSMMAAACGADSVTACEAFSPMAQCAEQVIAKNGYKDVIQLIPKRSTQITVGNGCDMPHRANILVTEVFDTELIGEGAIGTFHHAHEVLLEEDCLVVPRAANMYIQVVQSESLRQWNQLLPIRIKGYDDVIPPAEFSKCGGAPSLHDLQLDQISLGEFVPLSQPIKTFRFDYTGKSEIKFRDRSDISVKSLSDGCVDAIFMWWDIEMDPQGEVTLSCAPKWAHPTPNNMQWKDHWMQAIYYPDHRRLLQEGEIMTVISNHDDYSLWFDILDLSQEKCLDKERGICTCGAHIAYSRLRLTMLNDEHRNNVYIESLKQEVNTSSVCLCLGDGSLLPIMAAKLGAKKVFTFQPNPLCRRTLESYSKHNGTDTQIVILDKYPGDVNTEDFQQEKVDLIIAEPFFLTSILPWHNLQMWYAISDLANHLSPDVRVFPKSASLHLIPVEFTDLWKIRSPVENCEGFDLSVFDEFIKMSSDKSDANVEPHPLWEYPAKAVAQPIKVMDFTLSKPVGTVQSQIVENTLKFASSGKCNGVALWMEYKFGDDKRVTTGPITPPVPNSYIQWDRCTRQGVHLFDKPRPIQALHALSYKIKFQPKSGDFDFKFDILSDET